VPRDATNKPVETKLSVRRDDTVMGEDAATLTAGKTAHLTVALPVKEGWPEEGDYRCEWVAQTAGEGRPIARVSGLVHVRPPLAVTLRKYFVEGKLLVEADPSGLGGSAAALETILRTADGREFAHQQQKVAAGPGGWEGVALPTFEFDVAPLPPGTHAVEVSAADAAGGRLALTTVPLVKPEPPAWLHSQAGISDEVLPPWTPIEVERSSRGAGGASLVTRHSSLVTLKVSGRAYRFDGLPFPRRITTRDASILARPIALRVRADGQEVKLTGMLDVVKETPAQVVLAGTASGGGLRVDSTVTLDFDGNARVDLRLSATHPVRLERLVLEAPLKREHARYLYHFPGSWGSSRNAGVLPEEGWTSAFVPYVWLGDEDRGFALYTESDEGWQPADPNRAVEVRAGQRVVTLRMNLIGRPVELPPPSLTEGREEEGRGGKGTEGSGMPVSLTAPRSVGKPTIRDGR
jgi:hypothetical protein